MSTREFPDFHPAEEQLLCLSDGELEAADASGVNSHLASCWRCRSRMAELQAGIADFMRYEERVLRPLLPPPPRPWPDLERSLRDLDRVAVLSTPSRPRSVRPWLTAAAALLLAALLTWRFERVPSVSAAALLKKAALAEAAAAPKPRRIQIRTRHRSLTRAATLKPPSKVSQPAQSEDWEDLRKLFVEAHYDWNNPLSVEAFQIWRDQLPEKQDEVQTARDSSGAASAYRIHTSTGASVLTEATLTLRAQDLHALNETLQFHPGELVEISEVEDTAGNTVEKAPEAAVVEPKAPAHVRKEEPVAPPAGAGPAEEVRVIEALHRLGADLGEPVEVQRHGNRLIVAAMGLGSRRQQQLRSAVGSIPGVEVRFDEPQLMTSQPSVPIPQRRTPSGALSVLQLQLRSQLSDPDTLEEVTNRILDASEAAMARAYALRSLARRFSPEIEQLLSVADRSTLAGIRADHLLVLLGRVRAIDRQVWPALSGLGLRRTNETFVAPRQWQAQVLQVFDSTQQVDQLLNALLAGSDVGSGDRSAAQLAESLNTLDAQLGVQ